MIRPIEIIRDDLVTACLNKAVIERQMPTAKTEETMEIIVAALDAAAHELAIALSIVDMRKAAADNPALGSLADLMESVSEQIAKDDEEDL